MKKASKDQKPLPLERPAAVALSDEQVTEKSRRLCGLRAAVRGLQRDIKDATRTKKAEIKSIEATMLELETQIVEGIEMRAQGTLRYSEAEAAKKDLAMVAAAAGEPGAEAHAAAPSEPHAFHKPRGKRDECVLCGGTQADPVHDSGNGKGPYEFNATEPSPNVIRRWQLGAQL